MDELIYRRKIGTRLFMLRMSFTMLVILSFYAIGNHHHRVLFLLIFVLLLPGLAIVKDIRISKSDFKLISYYFFGLIKITRNSGGNYVRMQAHGRDFGEAAEKFSPVTDGELGCLFSIIIELIPFKIIYKAFTIEFADKSGIRKKQVRILLSREEYNLLQKFHHE